MHAHCWSACMFLKKQRAHILVAMKRGTIFQHPPLNMLRVNLDSFIWNNTTQVLYSLFPKSTFGHFYIQSCSTTCRTLSTCLIWYYHEFYIDKYIIKQTNTKFLRWGQKYFFIRLSKVEGTLVNLKDMMKNS